MCLASPHERFARLRCASFIHIVYLPRALRKNNAARVIIDACTKGEMQRQKGVDLHAVATAARLVRRRLRLAAPPRTLRQAGRRYQNAPNGRQRRAARQHRYWALRKKVTHSGSYQSSPDDLLPLGAKRYRSATLPLRSETEALRQSEPYALMHPWCVSPVSRDGTFKEPQQKAPRVHWCIWLNRMEH